MSRCITREVRAACKTLAGMAGLALLFSVGAWLALPYVWWVVGLVLGAWLS